MNDLDQAGEGLAGAFVEGASSWVSGLQTADQSCATPACHPKSQLEPVTEKSVSQELGLLCCGDALTAEKEGSTVDSFIEALSVEHKLHILGTHMDFEYEITSDVFVKSQLLYYKLSRRKRVHNGFGWILIGLVLIAIAWNEKSVELDPFLLTIIGSLSIYLGVVYFFPAMYCRRAYKKGDLAGKRFQADISESGFEVAGDLCSWRVQWEGVRVKGENEQVFILYGANTLFMFGKKYLSDEQQTELRRLIGLTLAKHREPMPDKSYYRVRRERRWSTAGVYPPGNWFAPPGSNQNSSGGNETAEASGAEGRTGDLASVQAVT